MFLVENTVTRNQCDTMITLLLWKILNSLTYRAVIQFSIHIGGTNESLDVGGI